MPLPPLRDYTAVMSRNPLFVKGCDKKIPIYHQGNIAFDGVEKRITAWLNLPGPGQTWTAFLSLKIEDFRPEDAQYKRGIEGQQPQQPAKQLPPSAPPEEEEIPF